MADAGIPKKPKSAKEKRADFVRRFAKLRTQRLEKRVGKKMIYSQIAMMRLLMNREIPTMVQHCVIKVAPKMKGSQEQKFLSAFNICGWVFQKYNYLKKSEVVMAMTGKGQKRNNLHQKEKESGRKNAEFNRLVRSTFGDDLKILKAEKTELNKRKERAS